MPSKKEIEQLGEPWLAMGEAAAPDRYSLPLDTSPTSPTQSFDTPNRLPVELEGYGSSLDSMRRINPYDWSVNFRHRRPL